MAVWKMLHVAMFLFNCLTILYCNQATARFNSDHLLLGVALEEYIGIADNLDE